MLALTGVEVSKLETRLQFSKTYTLEVPVDHSLAMNVDQPPSDAAQLEGHAVVSEVSTTRLLMENLQA
jgi:hypothetical protein